MTTKFYGACPHDCPDTCGFITEVENGRATRFYADRDNSTTAGWLCAKVRPYLNHVYHPERLMFPLRRTNPKTAPPAFERISWAEALGEISARWQGIIDEYGAEAILPYSYSGTLGAVQMGVVNGRFWNRLGASQLERSICGAAAERAVKATLGVRHGVPYADVEASRAVIIWGHNPISTAPHFMPHLKRAQKKGTQVVVIDPRRTRTAVGADWHIMPKPATDGALALGLAYLIVAEGWHDEGWLAAHSVGWPAFRELVAAYPPQRVADLTGISVADLYRLATLYATQTPSLIKFADGLQRHGNGGQTVRAICALPALTGQYGQRGGGVAYSASGYLPWATEVLNKWEVCPPPGRVINMNRLGAALMGEVQAPRIMSLFVFGANPAAASPRTGLVVDGLRRDDLFTVVHELFMTNTAQYADIVLPATSQLEQWDIHRAYGHTQLTLNEPALAPLGECVSNWDLMRRLAEAMGFEEGWLRQTAPEVIDELLVETAKSVRALEGYTLERLRGRGAVQLPFVPQVPFADLRFPTRSGKVELFSQGLADEGANPLPVFVAAVDEADHPPELFPPEQAFCLLTGAAHHFVTTSFGNRAGMLKREGSPFVEIHPEDAAVYGIEEGEVVEVVNGRGAVRLRAVLTDGVRRGVLVSPKGRWGVNSPDGRQVNWLTSDALGDLAGQSTFHTNRVWVRKVGER